MNSEKLASYVDKFSQFKVLVVGDVVLDHYVFGKVERLNPEAPVPILHAQKDKNMTGAAGNVAKNAAGLGAKTVLIGVVGNDEAAKQIAKAAAQEGYELSAVVDEGRPTIRKVRYLVGSQQMLRVDFEETHDVAGTVEKKLIDHIQAAIEGVDAVLISDYAKGVITKNVAEAIVSAAKKRGIPVAADIKPSRAKFVKGIDFVSPNLKEGHEFLGLNPLEHGVKKPQEIARAIHEKMNTNVFLTLSADGVYVVASDGTDEHVPVEHTPEVADPSGAGDTAFTTFVLAQLAGASPSEAAQLGNAAGSVVVGKVGSVGLTPTELKNMVTHHHE
ncbi:MAG: D-glycero-beta-D-manno-heptose-7-phosphate kinase [Candidatus Andersenbacteria bacterium]|nr:D-glycero-beta-D-manno-heptose-7-phosphate kinase [Candidatus Andersenbacteria bacterium]